MKWTWKIQRLFSRAPYGFVLGVRFILRIFFCLFFLFSSSIPVLFVFFFFSLLLLRGAEEPSLPSCYGDGTVQVGDIRSFYMELGGILPSNKWHTNVERKEQPRQS